MLAILIGLGLLGMALPMFGSDDDDDDQADAVSTSEGNDVPSDSAPTSEDDLGETVAGRPFTYYGTAGEAEQNGFVEHENPPPLSELIDRLTEGTGNEINSREDIANAVARSYQPYSPVFGDEGDNTIFGTDQGDEVMPWTGDDRVFLGEGDDVYDPILRNETAGNDFVRGGNGHDYLSDGIGFDTLKGDGGGDVLRALDEPGRTEADSLTGGVGNDILRGDKGDRLNGGEGRDLFVGYAEPGADPVIVEDFDLDRDELRLLMESDTPRSMASFDVSVEEEDGDSFVRVDGELTAVLEGVTGLDPSTITVGTYRW